MKLSNREKKELAAKLHNEKYNKVEKKYTIKTRIQDKKVSGDVMLAAIAGASLIVYDDQLEYVKLSLTNIDKYIRRTPNKEGGI